MTVLALSFKAVLGQNRATLSPSLLAARKLRSTIDYEHAASDRLRISMMIEMDWAQFGIRYLVKARSAAHEDFNAAMTELREYGAAARLTSRYASRTSWYLKCKSILPHLYHYSSEFTGDGQIPGDTFSSPNAFARKLDDYKAFVEQMADELDAETEAYKRAKSVDRPPALVSVVRERVTYILDAIDHVLSTRSAKTPPSTPAADVDFVQSLASRFHESVLSLKNHPHGDSTFDIKDEWDCQYLFRSILAAYFRDVRLEEWNPSVGGSSSRCEFFLKRLRIMVELKYVRKAADQRRIKSELLTDFADYGANGEVDFVVVLIYDPQHELEGAVALQDDLSGPSKGLRDVRVVASPPR